MGPSGPGQAGANEIVHGLPVDALAGEPGHRGLHLVATAARDVPSATVAEEAIAMDPAAEPRPTLVLNPPDDEAFRSSAERLVEDDLRDPSALQERLRERWPHALVRPRELAGEHAQIWYVYRDGHWVRGRR